ncbi:restriction endonuclease [Gracilimonas sp.]|uniref:restriction endonuclease n=1 Tax=Gracilimonas sp. TaxID=1974203 RepID=UPI0032EDBACF
MEPFNVIKATGEEERFSISKLKKSLSNAGAQPQTIKLLINNLDENGFFRNGITTKELYREAYRMLKQNSHRVASRYKLKEALLELGPSGYPFEVLISEIFTKLGYSTEVGSVVRGKCVSHEIDVIAQDESEVFMMECKFHNRKDHHCNVTIPLYVQARFQDVSDTWAADSKLKKKKPSSYIVTNTRFTKDAMDYAECMQMKLLSWDYPQKQGLRTLIEKTHIHPVTVLSSLTKKETMKLLNKNIVHCEQLLANKSILEELQFSHSKKTTILKEAEDLCSD